MRIEQFAKQLANADPAQPGQFLLERPIIGIPLDQNDYKCAKFIDFMFERLNPPRNNVTELLAFIADLSWWMTAMSFGKLDQTTLDYADMDRLAKVRGMPSKIVFLSIMFFRENLMDEKTSVGDMIMTLAKIQYWLLTFYLSPTGDI